MTAITFNLVAPSDIPAIQAQSGTQYTVNSAGLVTGVTRNDLKDLINAGFLVVGFSNDQAVFGASGINFFEEGNLYRNIGNPVAGNAADTTDDIIGGFQLPIGAFDKAGRGICITAQGKTGATANNKAIKLWINPTMAGQTVNADGSISGGTVSSAGTGAKLLDSSVVTLNAKGWSLGGNLFKYGAAGSNNQYFQGSTILDTTHGGILAPTFLTQSEAAVMNIVVTGTSGTTGAAGDVLLNMLELNAMN